MRPLLSALPSVGLLLSACAASPEVSAPPLPFEIPAAWRSSSGDTVSDDPVKPEWWQSLGGPQLTTLVADVLENNQDLRVAAARLVRAEAQTRVEGAAQYPTLDAGFNGSRAKQNFVGLPIPGRSGVLTTRSTSVGLSLTAGWELDLWGRLRATASASLADRDAAVADYAAARLSLIAQTSKAWFAAITAGQQLRLSEATFVSFRDSEQRVEERYNRGLRPSIDLRLARSNTATAAADVAGRRVELDLARRRLRLLLGRYPNSEPASPVSESPNNGNPESANPDNGDAENQAGGDDRIVEPQSLPALDTMPPAGLPAELLTRRPDIAALERRVAATGARIDAAKAARLPRISLTASGGTTSDDLGDLLDGDFSVWRLAGNVLQPIFQGGRLAAAVDVARAAHEEAIAHYVQGCLVAFSEIESALVRETQLNERTASLQIAVDEAVAAQAVAEERYNNGIDDYITVLTAQRTAFTLQSNLLTLTRQRLDTRVDFHLALGGSFESDDTTSNRTHSSTDSSP